MRPWAWYEQLYRSVVARALFYVNYILPHYSCLLWCVYCTGSSTVFRILLNHDVEQTAAQLAAPNLSVWPERWGAGVVVCLEQGADNSTIFIQTL